MSRNFEQLENLVRKFFSAPDVVEEYSQVGLFPSEEMIVDRFLRLRSRVLDVGCGAGRMAIGLSKKGFKLSGIDLVPGMIERAKCLAEMHYAQIDFQVMDAGDIKFDEETFENVISTFNVFDQIPGREKREKVLRGIFKICKAGGYFILGSRSGCSPRRMLAWPWIFVIYILEKFVKGHNYELGDKRWRGEYYHYLSPFYLKKLCKHIGFDLVYFNSEKRLVKGKRANWLTNFSGDRMLLYVFRKS